jgi:hypothetical protein
MAAFGVIGGITNDCGNTQITYKLGISIALAQSRRK